MRFHIAPCMAIRLGLFLLPSLELGAGIGANGFFDQYLVLGPYHNPGGDQAGESKQAEDFLCDGSTSEASILPAPGLVLELPQTGGCATEESRYLGSGSPTIQAISTSGDLLDLRAALDPNSVNTVAYAWVYVENLTSRDMDLDLAVTSDDGVQVKVETQEVFNISASLFYEGAGFIRDRIRITLFSGRNLIQFKVFQGGGHWGLRCRLEDPGTSAPLLSGDARVRVRTVPSSPGDPDAARTIAPDGPRAAAISLTAQNGGAPYTLQETLGPGWEVESATGSPILMDRTVTWKAITEPSVSYRVVRGRPFTRQEASISGVISIGNRSAAVNGDRLIPGYSPGFVGEVLLTPPFSLAGADGCSLASPALEGPWMGNGAFTDASLIPSEGLEFLPAFLGPWSQASGLASPLGTEAEAAFWATSGGAGQYSARLVRVAPDDEGTFDFGSIYGWPVPKCMNVAYFFALNDTDQDPLSLVLAVGSDDSAALRVNAEPVWSLTTSRPLLAFEDKIPILLPAGKNLLALYTFQAAGGYQMDVRFEDPTGIPVALETTLDPEGYVPPGSGFDMKAIQVGNHSIAGVLDQFTATRAGEVGLSHDPAVMTPVRIHPGKDMPAGTQVHAELQPANQCAPEARVAAGMTVSWILPESAPLLPAGTHEVFRISFVLADGAPAGSCSMVRFVSCLGTPGAPARNVVTAGDGRSIPLRTTGGELCIRGPEENPFRRGDANGDGGFDISDPVAILGCLFLGSPCAPCNDASDANDDGLLNIADPVYLLNWRFLTGGEPRAPFRNCGGDPTPDGLECEIFLHCP